MHVHTQYKKTVIKVCVVLKLDEMKIFTGLNRLTTPPSWPEFFVTQMLMHNLFAVAKLLINLL